MELYPDDLYDKIEFSKILESLSVHCFGAPAKAIISQLRPFTREDKISRMLDEIQEYLKLKDLGYEFPLGYYQSISEELKLLSTIDYVLETEQYLKIYNHLRMISGIVDFFKNQDRAEELPLLHAIKEQIDLDPALMGYFERIFTEEGKIKVNASPELNRIFRMIASKERELNKVFALAIERYKKQGFLTDNHESVKNSRRVLSVNAESKRKIKGVIHDESSTGKTVFIEPEEILSVNNELFELDAEKRHEIYRILKALSAELRPHLDSFELWQKILVRYDLIQAKAMFSRSYDGKRPSISKKPGVKLIEARHPLLYLLNLEQDKPTVPFSLELNGTERILVISGPNAGGKSVALKAMGLIQMMFQSGLLVPLNDQSTLSVFQKIMIDIGDQQSLEGDLSTYSSRLMHMNHCVEPSNRRSLVLIDELGSGSDPKMGGAIAEAVLDQLVKRKCFGLITTHYSNIKDYAYRSANIINGAMLFDKKALKPSYTLKLGQPGSSFAFELAEKTGMSDELLKYARKHAGKDTAAVDELLIDLQAEKKRLDDMLKNTDLEKKKVSKLIENYERMRDELEIRRKKLKKEAREKSYLTISDAEKEIQKLIREAKKEKKENKLKDAAKMIKAFKEDTREDIRSLNDRIFKEEIKKVENLEVGQFVKLRAGGDSARVIDFNEKTVKLEMGLLTMVVPRNEIIQAGQPIERKTSSVKTDMTINPYALETRLDIRGYSRSEAQAAVQEFFDSALMGTATQLKVLHGKGSGVLKKLVWAKAKEYKDIKKIWHPEEEFGGTGVSFISF